MNSVRLSANAAPGVKPPIAAGARRLSPVIAARRRRPVARVRADVAREHFWSTDLQVGTMKPILSIESRIA
jgi:hypothetical protein